MFLSTVLPLVLGSWLLTTINCAAVGGYVEFPFSVVPGSGKQQNAQFLNGRESKVVYQPIINEQFYYRIDAGLGDPSQSLQLLIDTGSSDMWVLDGKDPYCVSNKLDNDSFNALNEFDCSVTGVFDREQSETFNIVHDEFRIKYGDHSFAEGSFGKDQLTLGDVTVQDMKFGIGTLANSTIGILGIGLKANEATRGRNGSSMFEYDNLPILLKQQGHINKVAYSLFTNGASEEQGNLIFGGVDGSKYEGGLWTVPLENLRPARHEQPAEFTIQTQEITVSTDGCNEQDVNNGTSVTALLDSGTTLTYLPEHIISSIAEKFSADFSPDVGGYVQPCNFASQDHFITYYFSGVPIKVNLRETYFPVILNSGKPLTNDQGDEMCLLGFTPVKDARDSILGNSFLRSAYVVFDLENLEISLGQSSNGKREPQIEAIKDSIPGAKPASEYIKPSTKNGCGPIFGNEESELATTSATGETTPLTSSSITSTGKSSAAATIDEPTEPDKIAVTASGDEPPPREDAKIVSEYIGNGVGLSGPLSRPPSEEDSPFPGFGVGSWPPPLVPGAQPAEHHNDDWPPPPVDNSAESMPTPASDVYWAVGNLPVPEAISDPLWAASRWPDKAVSTNSLSGLAVSKKNNQDTFVPVPTPDSSLFNETSYVAVGPYGLTEYPTRPKNETAENHPIGYNNKMDHQQQQYSNITRTHSDESSKNYGAAAAAAVALDNATPTASLINKDDDDLEIIDSVNGGKAIKGNEEKGSGRVPANGGSQNKENPSSTSPSGSITSIPALDPWSDSGTLIGSDFFEKTVIITFTVVAICVFL